jgi:50S ribosomal subunit-associated GTPase HflX
LTVLNKADLLPDGPTPNTRGSNSVFLSAATGAGVVDLLTRISEVVVNKGFVHPAPPPDATALGEELPALPARVT